MSLSKIVTLFILILILFAGYIAYQFTATNGKKTTSKTSPAVSRLTVNGQTFSIEVAKKPADQQLGLSNRNSLDENNGMLFLFDKSDYYTFWMKDMRFALDILYIEKDKIVFIAENVPPPTKSNNIPTTIHPPSKADKVLEINSGLTQKYKIKKGDSVKIEL